MRCGCSPYSSGSNAQNNTAIERATAMGVAFAAGGALWAPLPDAVLACLGRPPRHPKRQHALDQGVGETVEVEALVNRNQRLALKPVSDA